MMEGDSLLTSSDEYRLLEAYYQTRRKSSVRQEPSVCMFRCSAQTTAGQNASHEVREMIVASVCCQLNEVCCKLGDDDKIQNVAEKLSQIVDGGLIVADALVADGVVADGFESDGKTENDVCVVQRLVELLKESGDELNEKIQRNHELLGYLQSSFTYSLFDRLATAFIKSVVPEHQQSTRNREQIALTFEVTSRLKALDLHPMNRVMGFGAKYLKKHFTPWVQQHGGWEKAFDDDQEVH